MTQTEVYTYVEAVRVAATQVELFSNLYLAVENLAKRRRDNLLLALFLGEYWTSTDVVVALAKRQIYTISLTRYMFWCSKIDT